LGRVKPEKHLRPRHSVHYEFKSVRRISTGTGKRRMKYIIFVDDETKVLDGIRRTLRPMRFEWDMKFLSNGQEALNLLSTEPCDVIISDIRMPNMNGIELLTKVKERFPKVVRIVLSGYTDKDLLSECTKVAHQFLAKPCDIETLKSTILQASSLKDSRQDQELLHLVSRLESLPSLPSLYQEILEEFSSPDGSIRRVGEIISKDVAMTAKMLQIVNSSYYGLPKDVTTAVQAATFLGFDVIKSLVLSVKVFSYFDNKLGSGFDIETLWSNCARSGALAQQIAKMANLDRKNCELAHMAGMLQDVGTLVLVENMPDVYSKITKTSKRDGTQIWQVEKKILGHSHMEVGAYLLRLWGLPKAIIDVIAFHHCPSLIASDQSFSLLSAVHIANCLIDHTVTETNQSQQLDSDYLASLGVLEQIPKWQELLAQNPAEEITQ